MQVTRTKQVECVPSFRIGHIHDLFASNRNSTQSSEPLNFSFIPSPEAEQNKTILQFVQIDQISTAFRSFFRFFSSRLSFCSFDEWKMLTGHKIVFRASNRLLNPEAVTSVICATNYKLRKGGQVELVLNLSRVELYSF